eukprot:574613-Pelagomonas_calceolata.AAC.3
MQCSADCNLRSIEASVGSQKTVNNFQSNFVPVKSGVCSSERVRILARLLKLCAQGHASKGTCMRHLLCPFVIGTSNAKTSVSHVAASWHFNS